MARLRRATRQANAVANRIFIPATLAMVHTDNREPKS
jgi:hypothetical protein